jgi:hypothetical protein
MELHDRMIGRKRAVRNREGLNPAGDSARTTDDSRFIITGPMAMSSHRISYQRPGRAAPSLRRSALSAGIGMITFTACATTGATFRSGVGDSFPDAPPYRAGSAVAPAAIARVAVLPIAYQRGASQADIFDPSSAAASPIAALLAEMNAYVDSLTRAAGNGVTVRLSAPSGTPPDVRFGCVQDASDDCADPSASGPAVRSSSADQPRMRLAVGRPSADWTASVRSALDQAGAQQALMLTLEVGQYWARRR